MISVAVDDLAFVAADAVARPVGATLRAITPVMRRLEMAAGDALLRQLRVQEPLEVGAAVVTGAGALSAPLMIHAVVATEETAVSREGVRRATASTLQRARDFAIDHLAIAPYGLGAGNLELEEAAAAMLDAMHAHGQRHPVPATIMIVVEHDAERDAFEAALAYAERPA